MKRISIAGLCLVALAVVSISGVAATTASAHETNKPYLDQCAEVVEAAKEGHWEDSQCEKAKVGGKWIKAEMENSLCQEVQETEKQNGSWKTKNGEKCEGEDKLQESPFVRVTKVGHDFTSKSGKGTLTAGAFTITCTADTNAGKFTGPKHIVVTITFTGCTTAFGLVSCQTAKAKEGEIKTVELKGWLFYINSAAKPPEVGVWLKANTGKVFAEFECGGEIVKVSSIEKTSEAEEAKGGGSCVAGRIKAGKNSVNEMSKEGEFVVKEVKGSQEIEKFEYEGKKLKCHLKSKKGEGKEEEATEESAEDKLVFEDAVDIIA
jgi:hypothetical protein